jgi:hypothetical protein
MYIKIILVVEQHTGILLQEQLCVYLLIYVQC